MTATKSAKVSAHDKHPNGAPLSRQEREKLLRPYLPTPRRRSRSPTQHLTPSTHPRHDRAKPLFSHSIPDILVHLIHKFLFHLIQLVFSIYIRVRQTYHALNDRVFTILYYHHRTPDLIRKDVKGLGKLPKHLSVIVDMKAEGSREAIRSLMSDIAELAAWCACAGIPMLSIYEKTGTLKSHIPELHHTTLTTFSTYFPRAQRPSLQIRAPNRNSYSPSPSPSRSPSPTPSQYDGAVSSTETLEKTNLNILLISAQDGRDTLVDLTKTLAEMSQKRKIAPADVTADLIHAEVEEATACKEPDLLVVMAEGADSGRSKVTGRQKQRENARKSQPGMADGQTKTGSTWGGDGICLRGYPPWQVRLTEIFYVQDSSGIGYQIFLRALHRFAKAEMRFGR